MHGRSYIIFNACSAWLLRHPRTVQISFQNIDLQSVPSLIILVIKLLPCSIILPSSMKIRTSHIRNSALSLKHSIFSMMTKRKECMINTVSRGWSKESLMKRGRDSLEIIHSQLSPKPFLRSSLVQGMYMNIYLLWAKEKEDLILSSAPSTTKKEIKFRQGKYQISLFQFIVDWASFLTAARKL